MVAFSCAIQVSELVQLISLLPPMFADQGMFEKMQDSMRKT